MRTHCSICTTGSTASCAYSTLTARLTLRSTTTHGERGRARERSRVDLFRYRGEFEDRDTGLLHFGRRWYDPALGRWLSQDPLVADALVARRDLTAAVMDIANLYVYVGNNPLNLVDPSGLGPPPISGPIKSLLEKLFAAYVRGRQIDWPSGQPKGTPTEQVEKKSVDPNEEEAADRPDEESEPGAGEGSRSPSSERTYERLERESNAQGGGGIFAVIAVTVAVAAWEGVKWTGAVLAAPETGGASLAGAAALP